MNLGWRYDTRGWSHASRKREYSRALGVWGKADRGRCGRLKYTVDVVDVDMERQGVLNTCRLSKAIPEKQQIHQDQI